ncbi:MAG: TRAP transporter large permease subunit [Candidatus Brocadiae bacterium]|nr:TRAP transporter large permease subunit [Candidatus Brocadiia bacterium]
MEDQGKKDGELPGALAEELPSKETKDNSNKPISHKSPRSENRFRIFSVLLALLGMPLFSSIASIALFLSENAKSIFIDVVDKLTAHTLFIPLPLFTFAGYILSQTNAPERLVRFSRALIGWLPGGTSLIAAISCAFFTAFTGASGVTIIALGGLLYPILIKEQHSENFTLGMITTGGSLGLLFPPSLPVILYGVIANTSMQGMGNNTNLEIKDLFLAGLIPGTLMILVVAFYGMWIGIRHNVPRSTFSWKELLDSTIHALPEILTPMIVILGYFGGYIQLTESAAYTALYVFFVEMFLYKELKMRKAIEIAKKSMVLIGAILIILMMAMSLTNLLIMAKVPDQILFYMKQHISSPLTFLILLNIFLLVVGCLMDIFSAILVVVPLIVPIAIAFQIDPIHLGIIFLTNLGIGYLTPPVGMNLFITSLRFKKSLFKVAYTCVPFLFLSLGVLGIITYIPAITLYPVKHPWILWLFFSGIFLLFIGLSFIRRNKE